MGGADDEEHPEPHAAVLRNDQRYPGWSFVLEHYFREIARQ